MKEQSDVDFARQLAKGRIVQSIFEEMMKKCFYCWVIPHGYEFTDPELVQPEARRFALITEKQRTQPDYIVMKNDTAEDIHVEVKYRTVMNRFINFRDALRIVHHWPEAYLFLATPKGFFMDKIKTIRDNGGQITPFLNSDFFQMNDTQRRMVQAYQDLLLEFIPNNGSIKPE